MIVAAGCAFRAEKPVEMWRQTTDGSDMENPVEYKILPQSGGFAVRITFAHNSIHRIGGFKTEDEARQWICEARSRVR
jgi:hypothetical protein